jgi:branched-chain amino acid transport system substrate-binding protein
MPQEWSVCPNIIYHSLHNSLGAFLSSKLAIKKGYKTGGMITGYYDGGYLQTYSLSKSFENEGGKICFNHATGYKEEDFTMEPLTGYLNSYPESAFLSLFSGDYLQWYFEKIKALFTDTNIPIFLTPFGFEETMLKNVICPSNNIHGIASWSKNIINPENKAFIETIESLGKTPNIFSLLGWESAELVKKIASLLESNTNNIPKVIEGLNEFQFKSPRGMITFYSKHNQTIAPLYEASIVPDANGNCSVLINSTIENTNHYFDDLYSQELEGITSAWYNSYVCI